MMGLNNIVCCVAATKQLTRRALLRYASTSPSTIPVQCPAGNKEKTAFQTEWDNARPYEEIPGPKPLPLLGNMWRFFPGGTYFGQSFIDIQKSWNKEYGSIMVLKGIYGRKALVTTFDADDYAKISRNEGVWPVRETLTPFVYYRMVLKKKFFKGYGGVVSHQGEDWFKTRSIINPVLMQPRVLNRYIPQMDIVTIDFLTKIDFFLSKNPESLLPHDFMNELNRWSLESVCLVALDTRLGCLDKNMSNDSDAQKMINAVNDVFDLLFQLDIKPSLWKYVSTPKYKKFIKRMDFVHEVCLKYIQQAEEKLKTKKSTSSDAEPSVLEKLLKADKYVAYLMAVDMLIAGIDTTSKTIGAAMYFLAKHPEAQEKLHQELKQILPDPNVPLTSQLIDKMHYLRACIKESQRIAPIAIGIVRRIPVDIVLSGYRIPKGTDVMTCNILSCNSDEYFKEAQKFIPERWIHKTDLKKNPFVYVPFGHGPRTCVGRRIAQGEMNILLARIFRKYKVEWPHEDMEWCMNLLYEVNSPLRFKLTPLKD